MKELNEDILRPISVLEYNARNFGIVVSRNKIRGKISLRRLHDALKVMVQRHPFLGATLYKFDENYYFKKRDCLIPLTIREGIKTEEERNRLYEEELNTPLNFYEQLWRVLIILDCNEDEINARSHIEMILVVQHAICDGLSILNLAKEILEQTQALQQGELLYENQILPVMPPMDQYLPGIMHAAPEQAPGEEAEEIDYSTVDVLDRDLSIPKNQCRIRYFDGTYSVPELRSLCHHCKHINVSVHGILAACMIKAISECVPIPSDRAVNLLLRNPVNRRMQAAPDCAGIGNQHLMIFVVSELILCPVGKTTPIIELAHQFMGKLDYEIKTHQALRRYQSVVESTEIAKINKEKDAQIMTVSNVGQIDTRGDYGDFELLETNFVSSNKFNVLQFSFTACAGHLNYLLLYTSPCYKTELIKVLHQRFREHLHNYIC
jgi:hypothetical protein